MQLERMYSKGRSFYQVQDDNKGYIANFDKLADAAVVLRYLSGRYVTDDERERAQILMARVDDTDKGTA